MIPHPVKIKAEVKVTCYTVGGVEDIKSALMEGIKASTNDIQVKIKMISSPLYEIYTETVRKNEGLQIVGDVVKIVEKAIIEKGGYFVLTLKPEILGDQGAKDIEEQLKDMNAENEIEDENENEDHDEGIKANIEGVDDVNLEN